MERTRGATPSEVARDRRDLLDAASVLSAELSLEPLLRRIVEQAVEITDARFGALGVLGPEGEIAEFITTGVDAEHRRRIGPPPSGKGILGLLITEGRPIRLANIASDPHSVGFPANHPPMGSFLGAPVRAGGQVFGNIYLTEKRSAPEFTEDDEAKLVLLAAHAGIAIVNARLYTESKLRAKWFEALGEISVAILQGQSSALETVARRARELVDGDVSSIAVPAETEGMLLVAAADGPGANLMLGEVFRSEGTISGEVIRSGSAIRVEDATAMATRAQPLTEHHELGPLMVLPLQARGEFFGTLAVGRALGSSAFLEDEKQVLESFAVQASLVLEYERAQREVQRYAVLEDRERIAKDLHDGVIQSLFAVGMGLQAVSVRSTDEALKTRLEAAVSEIDLVIRDLRGYIFGLRPHLLEEQRFDSALRDLARDFEARSGVTTVVDIERGASSQLDEVAGDLVLLAQEALSNVGRHAQAHTCRVSLRRDGGMVELEIEDDGVGYRPVADRGGSGLRNMNDRAGTIGASFSIEASPGGGTTVRVLFPTRS